MLSVIELSFSVFSLTNVRVRSDYVQSKALREDILDCRLKSVLR